MPRMQVYLPDDLHRRVKEHQLPVSEILQEAVRRELSRRVKSAALDTYLEELGTEVGEPTAQDQAYVDELMSRIRAGDDAVRAG